MIAKLNNTIATSPVVGVVGGWGRGMRE